MSRATDHDDSAGNDDDAWDEYDPALTPDHDMGRLNDEFAAALGGRSAIRNTLARGDLYLRRVSTAKKPKTHVVDAFRRTAVGMQRVDVGEHSQAQTNGFCRRNCPFGRACHMRVTTAVCMALFDVTRSGCRAAVKSAGPPVIMNAGFATQRGTFVFKLHRDAFLSKERVGGHLTYDPSAILQQEGLSVPGSVPDRPVCEGYAAFMLGFDANAGLWFRMRKRVETKHTTPYDDPATKAKHEVMRVPVGTSVLMAPSVVGGGPLRSAVAPGGAHGSSTASVDVDSDDVSDDGTGGDAGGRRRDDDDGTNNEDAGGSPNKRKKKKSRKTEALSLKDSVLRAKVTTWQVHWGNKIGDSMPVGPGSTEVRFVFPTVDVAQVHNLLRKWCQTHDMWDYWVELDQFKKWFAENKLVKLARKKGNFKCCEICLGRAEALTTCMPAEEPAIRAKYHVRYVMCYLQFSSFVRSRRIRLSRFSFVMNDVFSQRVLQTHLYQQETLRLYYYSTIVRSIDGAIHGVDFLEVTFIYDFMDQAKTACPHFRKNEVPKNCEGANQRIFRIMGVKVHGYGTYLYYVDETLPGGANITATILTDVMRRIYEIFQPVREILVHVQADNCGENKNRIVFGVMSALSHMAFKERGVKVRFENNYLMVNHTHEDIDQLFKLIADLLRHEHTITYQDLKSVVGRLKVKRGQFLVQIDVPCAYDFHSTFTDAIDPELHYYNHGKHQICVYWDVVKDRSAFSYFCSSSALSHVFKPFVYVFLCFPIMRNV